MIITKTPFRMSFFGGGTDLPEYFNQNKGSVISSTFDKYVYVTVRHLPRFFDYSNEITYSKLERVNKIDDIEHPMVKNAMKFMKVDELHISYDADLPSRTGLGTSSTFAVGLLNAFNALNGKFASNEKLAKDAIYLERVLCKEAGGWQDQVAAAYGGFNRIDFYDGTFKVTPIVISESRKRDLQDNLLLFFTGFTRFSAVVQEQTKKALKDKNKVKYLDEMLKLVDEAQIILEDKNRSLDDFGRLMDKTWKLKKSISDGISTECIDSLYEKGIRAGALGGKLLGAGGGGFILFYVPKAKQENVRKHLNLLEIPFNFEDNGTKVVYYSQELYESNTSFQKKESLDK